MKEVKNKCIKANNIDVEEFNVNTPDPAVIMKQKGTAILENLKNIFI